MSKNGAQASARKYESNIDGIISALESGDLIFSDLVDGAIYPAKGFSKELADSFFSPMPREGNYQMENYPTSFSRKDYNIARGSLLTKISITHRPAAGASVTFSVLATVENEALAQLVAIEERHEDQELGISSVEFAASAGNHREGQKDLLSYSSASAASQPDPLFSVIGGRLVPDGANKSFRALADADSAMRRAELQMSFKSSAEIFQARLATSVRPVEPAELAAAAAPEARPAKRLSPEEVLSRAAELFSIKEPIHFAEFIKSVGGIKGLSQIRDAKHRNIFHHLIESRSPEDANYLLDTLLHEVTEEDRKILSDMLVQCDTSTFHTPYSEAMLLGAGDPRFASVQRLTQEVISSEVINQGDFRNNTPPLNLAVMKFVREPNPKHLQLITQMIAKGANPNIRDGVRGSQTAMEMIHAAYEKGKLSLTPDAVNLLRQGEAVIAFASLYKSTLHSLGYSLLVQAGIEERGFDRVLSSLSGGALADQAMGAKISCGYDKRAQTPYIEYEDQRRVFRLMVSGGGVRLCEKIGVGAAAQFIDQDLAVDKIIAKTVEVAQRLEASGRGINAVGANGGVNITCDLSSKEKRVSSADAVRRSTLSSVKSLLGIPSSKAPRPTSAPTRSAAADSQDEASPLKKESDGKGAKK